MITRLYFNFRSLYAFYFYCFYVNEFELAWCAGDGESDAADKTGTELDITAFFTFFLYLFFYRHLNLGYETGNVCFVLKSVTYFASSLSFITQISCPRCFDWEWHRLTRVRSSNLISTDLFSCQALVLCLFFGCWWWRQRSI